MSDNSSHGRSIWAIAAAFVIAAVIAGGAMLLRPKLHNLASGVLLDRPRPIPAFALQDIDGHPLTRDSLRHHVTALFAGYTNCPDVCPTTLAQLSAAYGRLGRSERSRLRVLFVSIDPARDTLEKLRAYVHAFNPAFDAATGKVAELKKLGKAIGFSFSDTREAGGSEQVAHSAAVILIGPQARVIGYLSPPFKAKTLAADLHKTLETVR